MQKISDKIINRLTLYHCILVDLIKKDEQNVTSAAMAELLGVDDSQVRKDIAFLNLPAGKAKSRVGYSTNDLKNAIEKTLDFQSPKNAFIVGAGNLGMALAKYDNFANYGLNVLALFDNDNEKIGKEINGKEIYHISKLPELAQKLGVEMVILTVPSRLAQNIVNFLVNSKIKYIWNFSSRVLKVPKSISVWNENLMGNFLQFSYKILGSQNL